MMINQTLGQHTLALFLTENDATVDQAADLAASIASEAQQSETEKSSSEAVSPFLVSEERLRNPQTAEDRAIAEQHRLYTDSARRAQLHEAAQARQDAKDQFYQEFGYHNRMTEGLSIANGMASAQKPGQAAYASREEALAAIGSLSNIKTAVQQVNYVRDTISVPRENDRSESPPYVWANWKDKEAAQDALSQMGAEEQQMAADKRTHDLAYTEMKYNVAAAEFSRDFGISPDVLASRDSEGRVTFNDFEIISSKYGKLGEMRDGQLYLLAESGELVASADFWS